MPADLPPNEFGKIATLMLRLHADFRQRHGLPPLRSPWSVLESLEALKERSLVNDPRVLQSPRRPFGPLLEAVRWLPWRILKPLFDRQTDVNRDLVLAMEALVRDRHRDHQQSREAYRALAIRVAELETTVARLRERQE